MKTSSSAEPCSRWEGEGGKVGDATQLATAGIPLQPVSCWMSLRNVCVGLRERLWPLDSPSFPHIHTLAARGAKLNPGVLYLSNGLEWASLGTPAELAMKIILLCASLHVLMFLSASFWHISNSLMQDYRV